MSRVYVIGFEFLQGHGSCMHDQLTTRCVVGANDLIDLPTDILLQNGEVVSQSHIVFNDFQNEEDSGGNLVGFLVDDDVIPDDSEIA